MTNQFYSRKYFFKSFPFQRWLGMSSLKVPSLILLVLGAISVNAQTITNVGVSPTSICLGAKTTLSYKITNGTGNAQHFTSTTKYILYYSNGGPFTAIDQFTSTIAPAGDGASAVIARSLDVPRTLPPGSNYRVAIGSVGPNIDGSTGANASSLITLIASPSISYTKVFASSCNGGTDGSISVTATGGQAPYTYTWTGYPNPGSYSGNTPNIDNLPLGDYTIVVKDANQCAATVPGITIKQAPPVQVGYSKTIPTCAGNDGALNVFRIGGVYDGINPIQYKLDGDATRPYQNSGAFTGLTAGNYIVTAKDSKGCIGTTSVNLPTDTRPMPSVGISKKTSPGCTFNNGTISAYRINGVVNQTVPVQFKLDGPVNVPYQSSGEFGNLSAGSYTVTVKDSRGCTGTLPVVITPADPLTFTPNGYNTNVSACRGGNDGSTTVTVSGGVSPYHFILDGVEKTVRAYGTYTITGLQANVAYNVSVTDSKGCTISKSVTLAQELLPTVTIAYKGNATCLGGNDGFITVDTHAGGVPGYTYSKNGGLTFQGSYVFYNLAPNNYQVIVKDSKGCLSAAMGVRIADGTKACVAGRVGNISNTKNENRPGTDNVDLMNRSNPSLISNLSVGAYPNPFVSEFNLDVKGSNLEMVSIFVTDVTGRKVYQAHGTANRQYKLGSDLKKGIYIVQVMQQDQIQTFKIVKE